MAGTPGSHKQFITTNIAIYLNTRGFSTAECIDFRNLIHKKYKTEECLEILKEMRKMKSRKGIYKVLENHKFFK